MQQNNFKLLATSQTIEGINKLINDYFYSNIEVKENKNILTGNKSIFFDLYNSKGKVNNYTILKDKRYKFLMKM